jgi:FkbM family methyltransferase
MVHTLKKTLYKILGQALYLKAMHVFFYLFFDLGLLKRNPSFKYHYFVKKLVKKGDIVVDIGGNLGYFSKNFARLVGDKGQVVSIEPVKIFYDTLEWGLRRKKNCTVHNYALGLENKKIELVLPKEGGLFRTGLAHIPSENEKPVDSYVFETQMVRGSVLLRDLPRIDYIKCDIEGFEQFVLPELKEIFEKHQPLLQVETNGPGKEVVFSFMESLGYVQYGLSKNELIKNFADEVESGDYLFIHAHQEQSVLNSL